MILNIFHTSCPIVKTTHESLCQWLTVGGVYQKAEFVKEVLWIQESESQLLFQHGGKTLKEGSTYNDYYGYLSSLVIDSPTSLETATYYGISIDSSLTLLVKTKVFLRPAIESSDDALYNKRKKDTHRHQYSNLPETWRKEELHHDGTLIYPQIERVSITEDVTWSSQNTAEQNAELQNNFLNAWKLPKE